VPAQKKILKYIEEAVVFKRKRNAYLQSQAEYPAASSVDRSKPETVSLFFGTPLRG